jgi:hypothetical protein
LSPIAIPFYQPTDQRRIELSESAVGPPFTFGSGIPNLTSVLGDAKAGGSFLTGFTGEAKTPFERTQGSKAISSRWLETRWAW